MYFEAEMKGIKYRLEVAELKNEWHITILQEGKEKEQFTLSKHDYTHFDDAVSFLYAGRSYMMDVVKDKHSLMLYTQGSYRTVKIFNDETLLHESLKRSGALGDESQIVAGMPGKIVKLYVKAGEQLKANSPVLIMEAMKMENEIRAQKDCKVKEVLVKEGASVEAGSILVSFE